MVTGRSPIAAQTARPLAARAARGPGPPTPAARGAPSIGPKPTLAKAFRSPGPTEARFQAFAGAMGTGPISSSTVPSPQQEALSAGALGPSRYWPSPWGRGHLRSGRLQELRQAQQCPAVNASAVRTAWRQSIEPLLRARRARCRRAFAYASNGTGQAPP